MVDGCLDKERREQSLLEEVFQANANASAQNAWRPALLPAVLRSFNIYYSS